MARLPQPPINFNETRDVRDYLNALVRDLTSKISQIDSDIFINENRQKIHNQELSVTSNIDPTYGVVLCDASASAITVSLPDPYEYIYRIFHIKKINTNANTITVNCITSGAVIDNEATIILNTSTLPSIMCYSDGSNYWII